MESPFEELLPLPRSLRPIEDEFELGQVVWIQASPGAEGPTLERLFDALQAAGHEPRAVEADAAVTLELDPESGPAEGYALEVDAQGIRVRGVDPRGLAHGLRTLTQLVRASSDGRLPGVLIEDHPDFPQRGVMLDLSRDRVPTMETLYALVDRLAEWKFNQLQLYVEHTFAYTGHEEVWRGWDPLAPEDVRALDAYCAARHVELVPNQQSFGHMHHWLVHERYRPLAECPDGVEHPFLAPGQTTPEPFSLCPTDPRVLTLLGELYDELLPCFRSTSFNIGFDETFDLGQGRSKELCAERGVGRVYLDFLNAVAGLARERGRRPQFWADILLNHPELVPELPPDAVPLIWGYEADHPFEEQAAAVAAAGGEFLVCPGTSSWQSVAGRLANMTANIENATRHGRAHGAAGVLVTDWGDRGHLQPLTASWPGWITAADLSWNVDADQERRTPEGLAALLARHVFADPTGASGRCLVRLASLPETIGARSPNASPLSLVLTQVDQPFPSSSIEGLTAAGLEGAITEIDGALADLTQARMTASDAALVQDELVFSAGLLRLAALLGLQRLHAGSELPLGELPADARAPLRAELEPLIAEHRRLWGLRCRPGGREASADWLEHVLKEL